MMAARSEITSTSEGQGLLSISLDIDIDRLVGSFDEMRSEAARRVQRLQPTIFRVPARLRDVNPSAYEPQAISFGPYHHAKEHLMVMEDYKWSYFDNLLLRNGKTKKDYLDAVKEILPEARKCYEEPLGDFEDDSKFLNVMTLDGCFHVELRYKLIFDKEREKIEWRLINPVFRDMMLLENQVPFIVLQTIWNVSQEKSPKTNVSLVGSFLWGMRDTYSPNPDSGLSVEETPRHLVDLLRLVMFPHYEDEDSAGSFSFNIRSLSELQYLGVKLRKNEGEAHGLRGSFEEGVMRMNPLRIHHNSDVFLRNLIAFEQGYWPAGALASSYVVLMASLVDTPADAAILSSSKRGILINNLAGKDEVSALFDSLSKEIQIKHRWKLYRDVDKYCNSRRREWMAEFKQNFLSSPLKSFGFLVAALLFLLTVFQGITAFWSWGNQ